MSGSCVPIFYMLESSMLNLDDPLVLDWATRQYARALESGGAEYEEMESSWFHELFIARLFDRRDYKTLRTLFRLLPVIRFEKFVPLMLNQWR